MSSLLAIPPLPVPKDALDPASVPSRNGDCVQSANWVATFDLGTAVPLVLVAMAMQARMDYGASPALLSRTAGVHTTESMFNTGHVLLIGCKSEDHALYAAHLLVYKLWRYAGVHTSMLNFAVQNHVCRLEFPYSLPKPKKPDEPLPPTGGVRMCMLRTELLNHPCSAGSVRYNASFAGMHWKARIREQHCDGLWHEREIAFVFFERGRGVATGGKHRFDHQVYNSILHSLPHLERGNEFRDPTEEELEFERIHEANKQNLAHRREAQREGKKTSRKKKAPAAATRGTKRKQPETSTPAS